MEEGSSVHREFPLYCVAPMGISRLCGGPLPALAVAHIKRFAEVPGKRVRRTAAATTTADALSRTRLRVLPAIRQPAVAQRRFSRKWR